MSEFDQETSSPVEEIELELCIDNVPGLDLNYATPDRNDLFGKKYALNRNTVMPARKRWQDFAVGQRFMAKTNSHRCVSEITRLIP